MKKKVDSTGDSSHIELLPPVLQTAYQLTVVKHTWSPLAPLLLPPPFMCALPAPAPASRPPLRAAACRYRAKLEACLPEIFVSFQATHKAADSRMVQEALRRAVLRLLRVWRDRFIFNDDYINGLQVRPGWC